MVLEGRVEALVVYMDRVLFTERRVDGREPQGPPVSLEERARPDLERRSLVSDVVQWCPYHFHEPPLAVDERLVPADGPPRVARHRPIQPRGEYDAMARVARGRRPRDGLHTTLLEHVALHHRLVRLDGVPGPS